MRVPNWPTLLSTLLRGESLSAAETEWAMGEVMTGEATPVQVAGFAIALRAKGETAEEVEGLVRTMLAHATPIAVSPDAVDVVGTGGDRAHTVNISTMSALVVAGAGVRVVKHGNRAASSTCGSADLLEELGVPVDLGPDRVARCVEEAGIGFCFAPLFHAALRHTSVPRRQLGVATVFNFLGPLSNPAQPEAAAIGVSDARMAPVVAGVCARRGTRAVVFRGEDGLDELTTTAPSRVWVVAGGEVAESVVDPVSLDLPVASLRDLRGGDAAFNAAVARSLLAGERGPVRDAVLLNAAAALVAYDGELLPTVTAGAGGKGGDELADRLTTVLHAGIERAARAIDSGAAADVLDRWLQVARDSLS